MERNEYEAVQRAPPSEKYEGIHTEIFNRTPRLRVETLVLYLLAQIQHVQYHCKLISTACGRHYKNKGCWTWRTMIRTCERMIREMTTTERKWGHFPTPHNRECCLVVCGNTLSDNQSTIIVRVSMQIPNLSLSHHPLLTIYILSNSHPPDNASRKT